MLSARRFAITFWLVLVSFAVASAQEDKPLNTPSRTKTVTASASTGGTVLHSTGRGVSASEPKAVVTPADGTGTRNFIPKWLETGGRGMLGDSIIFDRNGSIGIGTTTPGTLLDVAGKINAATQYHIGGNRVLSVAGNSNTFVGVLAGDANTGGDFNAFFGTEAGRVNNTGGSNSFFGSLAGSANTSGLANSFFGSSAGFRTTTGNFNSYFGKDAGRVSTTGQDNAFFGAFAGDFNTTGGDNSFFGTGSGRSNTTGRSNTLIGKLANVGSGNLSFATAIGAQAIVTTSNTIVLGRPGGQDEVRIPSVLFLRTLATNGTTPLCRNASTQIATCSSSLRYKQDVTPFGGGLSLVRQLRPITFRWKTDGTPDVGFGAEDVAQVAPLFVTHNSQGEIDGVKYGQLSAVLVNAVQEQQTQIAAQQEQLKRQQNRIEQQQNQLQQQQSQIESLKRVVCLAHPKAEACR